MKQHIEAVLEWSFRILLLALVTAMIAFYFKMRDFIKRFVLDDSKEKSL